jgi:hypothetical protein
MEADLISVGSVPLGYDYDCDKKSGCAGSYRSLNSPGSKDMTGKLYARIDHINILNKPFSIAG